VKRKCPSAGLKLALGRVYEIAARHPILSYHVSFAINWRFPPAGYPPPKTLASSPTQAWPTLGQEKRTFWPANQRNSVEQSGKRHYRAVIVTPDQAFKILMALPESERVLTLVIAATGLRLSEALGLQWQGLCQSADQSSPGMGEQQSDQEAIFSQNDTDRAADVCVIGRTVREQLFGVENPVGKVIRVSGLPCKVVATLHPKGLSFSGQDQDDTIILPYTTAQKKIKGITWLDDILCSAVSQDVVKMAGQESTVVSGSTQQGNAHTTLAR